MVCACTGIAVAAGDDRALSPYSKISPQNVTAPEGPPEAGVSKDGRRRASRHVFPVGDSPALA
jgi:hypothetical protein